jgi:N-acetylneuraminic acid mutarotase
MRKSVALMLASTVLLAACLFAVAPASASSSAWVSRASMHVARSSLGVAVVDGQIYAIGGLTDPPSWIVCTGANEKYNPQTDQWTPKASMPTPRASFATAVYNGKIYCIGGTSGAKNSQIGTSGLNEVYDPATDQWTTKASMPTPRVGVTASTINGKIYLLGGNSSVNEVYDPETDLWTTKASMPMQPGLNQIWSCTSATSDGKIYVFGASILGYSNQVYNPQTDTWSTGAPLVQGYLLATCAATAKPNQIYVFGVDSTWWDIGPPHFTSLSYSPLSGGWRVFAMMPTPRVNAAVAVVNDLVYVIGGSVVMIENNAHPTAVNEQYSPLKDQPSTFQAPTVTVQSPQNKTYTGTVQLSYSTSTPSMATHICIDGQNIHPASSGQTLNLPLGAHNITVYAIDEAGNVGASETVAFSVAEPQGFPALLAVAAIAFVVCILVLALYLRKKERKTL